VEGLINGHISRKKNTEKRKKQHALCLDREVEGLINGHISKKKKEKKTARTGPPQRWSGR